MDCARLVDAGECGRHRSQAYMRAHCAASCDDHDRAIRQAAATPQATATATATATAMATEALHGHGAQAHEHEHLHPSDSDGFHTQVCRGAHDRLPLPPPLTLTVPLQLLPHSYFPFPLTTDPGH